MKKLILLMMVLWFSIVLQAQTSKTITDLTPGGLITQLTSAELHTVNNLTLSGTIDARDFRTMRDNMTLLEIVDLTNALIAEYTGSEGTVNYEIITYPANTLPYNALIGKNNLKSIALPVSITAVGNNAFAYCNGLTSVNLPSSVVSIGECAFLYCGRLKYVFFPPSVTSISSFAFLYCRSLTSINIPASVTTIGKSTFAYSTAFITVDSENINYSCIDGILFNKDKTDLIHYLSSKAGEYTIPSSVKTINEGAFSNCSLMTSVTIPNSVTVIEQSAFIDCTGLTSVSIPNSVTLIGAESFYNCTGLTMVTIPNSVTTIGELAFGFCMGLTSVTIPNSVTSVGDGAFSRCTGLKEVTISNSVTTIGNSTFGFCTGLISVNIPASVTMIGEHAFYDCTGLTSVTIPASVTTIGYYAFCGCTGLTSVTIPSSVTSIGEAAFAICNHLESIYAYPSTPADLFLSSTVFEGVNKNTCTLYVPYESLNLYKAADGWKDFIKTDVITATGKEIKNDAITVSPNPAKDVITINAQKGVVSIYNSDGKLEITQSLENNKQVNISSLKPGMYVVVIIGKSFKIIKE